MATILLIEDSESQRLYIKAMLNSLGFSVVEAGDGEQAIKLFRKNPTDLVLTDIFMPQKEGLSTIMELKEISPGLKIIAMSSGSRALPDALEMAADFGADVCIEKPLEVSVLSDNLTRLLHTD